MHEIATLVLAIGLILLPLSDQLAPQTDAGKFTGKDRK